MKNIFKSKIFLSAILAVAVTATAIVVAVNVSHSGNDLQRQLDLGEKYVSELDYENAIIAYEEALEIDPYCLEAYLGLSEAYLALGQQDKAIEIMQQAKDMLPESVEIYVSLAQLYASQNQIDLVISTLEEGIKVTNSDRLKEMLKEYQQDETQPKQAESNYIDRAEDGKEEPSSNTPDDEKGTSIVIGLQQDAQQQDIEPVIVITQEDEEPVTIPLSNTLLTSVSDNNDVSESIEGNHGSGSDGESNNGSNNESGSNVQPDIRYTGIVGEVYGTDGHGIEGVTLKIYSGQDEEPIAISTDMIGRYMQELLVGSYRIVLSKEGYAELSTAISVWNDTLTSCDYIMLTTEESQQSAALKGIVISAVDSHRIEGAAISLHEGFCDISSGSLGNVITNGVAETSANGEFSIDSGVNAGYYTVEASKDGYSTYIHNETIKPGENEITINMSPLIQVQGEYRIVLTWGETPRDLDSHLICTGSDNYHVYFANKNSDDENASLDRDDTDSYGPETITVKIEADNSYIYAVHNFTDQGAAYGQNEAWNLAHSNAKVTVYSNSGIIFDGNVPVNAQGTTWEVFRIENGQLLVENNVSFERPEELTDSHSLIAVDNTSDDSPAALSLLEDEKIETQESVEAEEAETNEMTDFTEDETTETKESAVHEELLKPEEIITSDETIELKESEDSREADGTFEAGEATEPGEDEDTGEIQEEIDE